jgi:hypothetical protein
MAGFMTNWMQFKRQEKRICNQGMHSCVSCADGARHRRPRVTSRRWQLLPFPVRLSSGARGTSTTCSSTCSVPLTQRLHSRGD